MWLFTSGSFLSVVADRNSKRNLLVRARVKGHIDAVFPDAKVFTDENADYLYRAVIPRKLVAKVIAGTIGGIDYDNFKNSVGNTALHGSYLSVWGIMRNLQEKLLRGRTCD